jgi:DNA-binding response OmpR family regulator
MKKILIVDDEKDISLMLKKRLTAEGYSVITANDGYAALALAKSQLPDLIILDIIMPGMEGVEVAEKLKEHPLTKNIPVIFLTAILRKTEDDKKDHIIAGNIILAKPIDTEELLAEIKGLLCSVTTS